jgi:hypothetical protein
MDGLWQDRGHMCGQDQIGNFREMNNFCIGIRKCCIAHNICLAICSEPLDMLYWEMRIALHTTYACPSNWPSIGVYFLPSLISFLHTWHSDICKCYPRIRNAVHAAIPLTLLLPFPMLFALGRHDLPPVDVPPRPVDRGCIQEAWPGGLLQVQGRQPNVWVQHRGHA